MQVKGVHTFKVSRAQLWQFLIDPEVLANNTPGISKRETIDTDHYKSISDIKIGPVKGSFKGKLKVLDKNEPESFTIEMEQLSKIGNAHGKIAMNLAGTDSDSAELSFDGKVNLSGVIARTGQRVLSGVANTITKEVFASLEQHIEEEGTKTQQAKPAIESVSDETAESEITHDAEPASPDITEPDLSSASGSSSSKEHATRPEGIFGWINSLFKKLFG